MIIQSRREFVALLLASGASFGNAHAIPGKESVHNDVVQNASVSFPPEEGWMFAFDGSASMAPSAQHITKSEWIEVRVPHTWQAIEGNPDYVGVAWYQFEFTPPQEWAEQFVRIEFEAVTHTAHVFLNGKAAGQHVGKGYTAFTCDLSQLMEFGAKNVLMVRADNRPSNTMLPRSKSYDWTDDGG